MTSTNGELISRGSSDGPDGPKDPAKSDDPNHTNETKSPGSRRAEGPSPHRHRYSIQSLRALRHNHRFAVPENIARSRGAPRPKIPKLKPNPSTPFSALSLPKELSDALASLSLTTATPIQATAIPYARLGGDLVAQATSGTGKTLTYALVALDSILPPTPTKSALIIVPARELASQVADVFAKLSTVRVLTLVGGTKESIDEERLSRPAHVVVGTPGRVEAMIARGALDVESVKVLVLDEADRLLDGSFGGSVERICNMLPSRQTLAFSATYSYSFRMSLLEVMREPAWIGGGEVVLSGLQLKDQCHDLNGKISALQNLLRRINFKLCVVFFNTKKAAARVVKSLTRAFSFQTKLIHAGMTQKERDAVIRDVRQGKVRVLVTTDVLARGIDFDTCDFVVQMDVPLWAETYLHRVGRAGRFGRNGCSLLMFDESEVSAVRALEEDLGYTIGSQPVQSAERSCKSPVLPSKDATYTTQPFWNGNAPEINHGGQKNEKDMQLGSNDVQGKKSEARPKKSNVSECPPVALNAQSEDEDRKRGESRAKESHKSSPEPESENTQPEGDDPRRSEAPPKESNASTSTPVSEKAQPQGNDPKVKVKRQKLKASSDIPKETKKASPLQRLPLVPSSSLEEAIPQLVSQSNDTYVNQKTSAKLDESLQPQDKSKEQSKSFSVKRARFLEEPSTPAKKRKSARQFARNLLAEETEKVERTNAETVSRSSKPQEGAPITLKKRRHKLFKWLPTSNLQDANHQTAQDSENTTRFANTGNGSIQRTDAPPLHIGKKQSDLERRPTPSRNRILELARPNRGSGMEEGQDMVAGELNQANNINVGAASPAKRAQAEADPSDDLPCQQRLNNDNRLDVEPSTEEPQGDIVSEECREAWDTYADAAYNTGYREAYEEAFRMAQELRQRLELDLR